MDANKLNELRESFFTLLNTQTNLRKEVEALAAEINNVAQQILTEMNKPEPLISDAEIIEEEEERAKQYNEEKNNPTPETPVNPT